MADPAYISVNGDLVPYADATTHLLTPAVKYGALVFEGLRAYWNADSGEVFVFRLAEHFERFRRTLRAVKFDAQYSDEDLTRIVIDVLRANEVRDDVHLRVAAYIEGTGLYDATGPVSIMCASYGRASGSLESKLTKAGVVSWRRIGDTAMPPRLKVAANYHNGRLAALEAKGHGYDEPIILTERGHVAEGAGSCLLVVRDRTLIAPPVTDGILESITRRTLLELAATHGVPVAERSVDRTELYFCDEAFFCGTGVEMLPVASIDGQALPHAPGPITQTLWKAYEAIVRGQSNDRENWRTAVWRR